MKYFYDETIQTLYVRHVNFLGSTTILMEDSLFIKFKIMIFSLCPSHPCFPKGPRRTPAYSLRVRIACL